MVSDEQLLEEMEMLGFPTYQCLTRAIEKSVEKHSIATEDAERMAEHLLNFFGYSDRIIDNILQPNDRDVFYIMEDTGILAIEKEEITLHTGKEWRINYFVMKTNKIKELLRKETKKPSIEDKINNLLEQQLTEKQAETQDYTAFNYEKLPAEIWERA